MWLKKCLFPFSCRGKKRKGHIYRAKSTYLPNLNVYKKFNIPTQFGGELCEKRSLKIRKSTQKLHFWIVKGRNRSEKSKFRKTHLLPLLRLHTKFQLSCSIWRRDRRGTPYVQGQNKGKSLYLLFYFY